jgi:hypothetical protein
MSFRAEQKSFHASVRTFVATEVVTRADSSGLMGRYAFAQDCGGAEEIMTELAAKQFDA